MTLPFHPKRLLGAALILFPVVCLVVPVSVLATLVKAAIVFVVGVVMALVMALGYVLLVD